MDVCLKLLMVVYFVHVVASRTVPTVAKGAGLRSRLRRNAIHSHESSPATRQFIYIKMAPPAEIPTTLHANRVLECEASGSPPPTFHWLRNGRFISQGLGDEQMEESNAISEALTPVMGMGSTKSRLYLDCIGPQDEAEYTCVAETPYQRDTASTRIIITGDGSNSLNSVCVSAKKSAGTQARINMWTGGMLETIGNDALLFCRTLGGPHPRVTWYLDDKIDNNAKYQVQENGDLLIRNVEWADMGGYVCVAENALGRDSAETFLYPVKADE